MGTIPQLSPGHFDWLPKANLCHGSKEGAVLRDCAAFSISSSDGTQSIAGVGNTVTFHA